MVESEETTVEVTEEEETQEVEINEMEAIVAEIAAEGSDEVESGGEEADEDEPQQEVEEEATSELEEEAIAATTQDEPERSKTIPRDRFDKVNDAKKTAEEEVVRLQAENEEYKKAFRENLDAMVAEQTAPEVDADDFAPLDQEAYDKQNADMDKLRDEVRGNSFVNAMETDFAFHGAGNPTEWLEKQDACIAVLALDSIQAAADMGRNLTDETAWRNAAKQFESTLKEIYSEGKSMGEYVNKRSAYVAKRFGKPAGTKANPKLPLQKGVDVVELGNLRRSAGSPTNKTIGSRMKNGNSLDALQAEAEAEWQRESTF